MTTETNDLDSAAQTVEQTPPETPDQTTVEDDSEPKGDEQDKDAALKAAQAEAKMWKGRAEKATKKPKSDDKSSLDTEEVSWMIQNQAELKVYGNRVTELRQKGLDKDEALKFARLEHDKSDAPAVENQAAISSPSNVAFRSTKTTESVTDTDQRFGVTPEIKAKWKDVVEGA